MQKIIPKKWNVKIKHQFADIEVLVGGKIEILTDIQVQNLIFAFFPQSKFTYYHVLDSYCASLRGILRSEYKINSENSFTEFIPRAS
jgi:hypothetical protein